MAGIEMGDFNKPNESRTPPGTKVDMVKLGSIHVARATMEPGWKWSTNIKPIVKTDSCQVHHVGVVQSGRLQVKHEDGSELELTPGNVYVVEPGHDAWVIGDEPFVGYEFDASAAQSFGKS
jgi:mannose-6-phosphate isomerase-like protein (cupin superfamily)